jgi:hypothetical protein
LTNQEHDADFRLSLLIIIDVESALGCGCGCGDVSNGLAIKLEVACCSEMLTMLHSATEQQLRNRYNMPNALGLYLTVM